MKKITYWVAIALLSVLSALGMEYTSVPPALADIGVTEQAFQKAPLITLPDGSTIKAISQGDAGRGIWVIKQRADGSLAADFGNSGIATFDSSIKVEVLSIELTNSTIVVTSKEKPIHGDYLVVRLNLNGTPDTTFGLGGKRIIRFAELPG